MPLISSMSATKRINSELRHVSVAMAIAIPVV